jgi:hypothetical protein
MGEETQKRVHAFWFGLSSSDLLCFVGLIMSMHLLAMTAVSPPASGSNDFRIQLLCAYENGSVTLWRFIRTDKQTSVEGIGWEAIWTAKLHVESGVSFQFCSPPRNSPAWVTVMAMAVSADSTLALTVSADHLIGRYDLMVLSS